MSVILSIVSVCSCPSQATINKQIRQVLRVLELINGYYLDVSEESSSCVCCALVLCESASLNGSRFASVEFEQELIDKAVSIIITAELATGFIGYSSSGFCLFVSYDFIRKNSADIDYFYYC